MNRSIRSLRRNTLSVFVQASVSSLFAVSLAHAETCTLNTNADDPADASAKVTAVPPSPWSGANNKIVTLRDCIVAANLMTGSTGAPNGTMMIDAGLVGGQTIALQDNLPLLFNNTTINGGGGAAVTIDGGGTHRIFFVSGLPPIPASGTPDPDGSQATSVSLSNLILQNGNASGGSGGGGGMGAGGALFVNKAASVVLTDVSFGGNIASGGSGGSSLGGGGMGAGASSKGGGGLNSPSTFGWGAGVGTTGAFGPGGFGGTGLGQLSANQGLLPAYFDVDAGAGTSGGLIGGGGSILTIPVLVYLFGVQPLVATGYSLFIVGSTSLVGAIKNYRKGFVDIKTALYFSIASTITVLITRKFLLHIIPDNLFSIGGLVITKSLLTMILFAVVMLFAAVKMIVGKPPEEDKDHLFKAATGKIIFIGISIGLLTGLLGAGGGFLIIPALIFLFHLPVKEAIGTSLMIISINSLIGFTGDIIHTTVNWSLLLPITVMAVAGIFIGTKLGEKIHGEKLKKGFGWFVLVMGIYILIKEISAL